MATIVHEHPTDAGSGRKVTRRRRREPAVTRLGSSDESKLGFLDAEAELLQRSKRRFQAELETLQETHKTFLRSRPEALTPRHLVVTGG